MGDRVHGYSMLVIGGLLMAGVLLQDSLGTQLVLSGIGFLFFSSGLIFALSSKDNEKTSETKVSVYLRMLGSFLVIISTALPYLPLPMGSEAARSSYSIIGLVQEIWAGAEIEGALVLIIFASVVVAGAAASLLHYSGGYVVLFGITGYTHIVTLLTDKGIFGVILTEFRSGVYLATAGGLLVVLSSLLRDRMERGGQADFIHESYRYRSREPDR